MHLKYTESLLLILLFYENEACPAHNDLQYCQIYLLASYCICLSVQHINNK